jgi:hypothetical protein
MTAASTVVDLAFVIFDIPPTLTGQKTSIPGQSAGRWFGMVLAFYKRPQAHAC